jgi:hypothetical protein
MTQVTIVDNTVRINDNESALSDVTLGFTGEINNLSSAISAEAARATAAEAYLGARVDTNESALSDTIIDETTRATAAEAYLGARVNINESALSDVTLGFTGEISNLSSAIIDETTRAKAAEAENTARITTLFEDETVTVTNNIKAKRYVLTAAPSSARLDLAAGNVLTVTLSAPTTLTVINEAVGTYLIKLVQNGDHLVSFPTAWKWSGGIAPTVTATAGKTDIVTLIYDGQVFYAAISQNF